MQETPYLKGRDDLIDSLKKIPFLESYEDDLLKNILQLSKIRRYSPNEVITHQGDYDCWLYVILKGEVRIVRNEEEIARLNAQGGTFGELAVIDGEARSASVYAVTDTACLAIDGSFMDRLEKQEKIEFEAVYYRLLSVILANRLRTTSEELSHLKQKIEITNITNQE
jgi:CRP/FNR family transcriptional regulator, cyclic AMP receptor protein